MYYGSEFCQTLLPNMSELSEAYMNSAGKGFGFTFVTPPVTDKGLEKLKTLFMFLAGQNDEVEVVINDWGVLRLLNRDYPRLKSVFGRLMNKMLRDPRITPRYNIDDAPKEPLLVLQQSGITYSRHYQVLKSCGIKRVELDNLYQGIEIDFKAMEFKPSIYIPYGYVTTGRVCIFGALNQQKEKKFTAAAACQKECQRYSAILTNPSYQTDSGRLFQRGNTIFYRQNEEMVEKALIWSEQHGARVVYQPVPFERTAHATEDIGLVHDWIKESYDVKEVIPA